MYLVMSGEHRTYRQEWKIHEQTGHSLSQVYRIVTADYTEFE